MNMFKSVAACAAGALMLGTAGLASPDRAEAADGVNFAHAERRHALPPRPMWPDVMG